MVCIYTYARVFNRLYDFPRIQMWRTCEQKEIIMGATNKIKKQKFIEGHYIGRSHRRGPSIRGRPLWSPWHLNYASARWVNLFLRLSYRSFLRHLRQRLNVRFVFRFFGAAVTSGPFPDSPLRSRSLINRLICQRSSSTDRISELSEHLRFGGYLYPFFLRPTVQRMCQCAFHFGENNIFASIVVRRSNLGVGFLRFRVVTWFRGRVRWIDLWK